MLLTGMLEGVRGSTSSREKACMRPLLHVCHSVSSIHGLEIDAAAGTEVKLSARRSAECSTPISTM